MLIASLPKGSNSLNARLIPLLILVMIMAGCRNREKGVSEASLAGDTPKQEFRRILEQVNPGLRDPAALIKPIKMTGAVFRNDLVNASGCSVYLTRLGERRGGNFMAMLNDLHPDNP